jgi:hypothetical protein
VSRSGELNEGIVSKIEWAKAKADSPGLFISKKDKYMDSIDKDEIIKPDCPKMDIWSYPIYYDYQRTPLYSFWSNSWRKRH